MLSSMGYTISGGGHKLHPEEAVYLLESNNACIRVKDVPISIQQAYRLLLEANNVSWADFFVFTHLKRAGYIVLPFRLEIVFYFDKKIVDELMRSASAYIFIRLDGLFGISPSKLSR